MPHGLCGFGRDDQRAQAQARRSSISISYLYLGLFAGAWTGYVWFTYRHIQALGENTLAYADIVAHSLNDFIAFVLFHGR